MAQAKECKRLLKKDGNSPSGFKPVGYQYQIRGDIFHNTKLSEVLEEEGLILILEMAYNENIKHPNWIDHDSFEQGIKVNDEWWFDGDELGDEDSSEGILWFDKIHYFWTVGEIGDFENSNGLFYLLKRIKLKRIGNIHEAE